MMQSQISQLSVIIAHLACYGYDLIFTVCSVNDGLSNDLKVRWSRIAKLSQLRAWLFSSLLSLLKASFQSEIGINLKNAQLSGSTKVCDTILENLL